MHDQSEPMALGGDLPQLLDADAVLLRIDAVAQIESRHQFLRQRAAASFGEQRVARMELHARLISGLVRPVLGNAHVAGRHAAHRAGIGIQDFGCSESGIDLDAQRLGLLREPLADVAKAHDVVAVIAHQRRQQPLRNRVRAGSRQDFEAILADRRVQRCTERLPIGQQLVERNRVDDRAGQDVRADRRAFFQHADADLVLPLARELLQANRRRQAGGTGADDHHIELHRFALHAYLGFRRRLADVRLHQPL